MYCLISDWLWNLQLGHRESIDIDLFSDVEYGSINFIAIEDYLQSNFEYVDHLDTPTAMGKSYFIGQNKENTVKLDLYYTDHFIQPYT